MMWGDQSSSQEESIEIMECTSLISNNFTLNSSTTTTNQQYTMRSRNQFASNFPSVNIPSTLDDNLSFFDEPIVNQIDDDDELGSLLSSDENSPQRFHVSGNTITIEKYDSNSFDSGYSSSQHQQHISQHLHHQSKHFKFTEPRQPNKRLSFLEPSPNKKLQQKKSPCSNFRIFHSLSSESTECTDDDYDLDLMEMESIETTEESSIFPSNLNSLISGHIKSIKPTTQIKTTAIRPKVRRCLSLTNEHNQQSSPVHESPVKDSSILILKENDALNKERCFKRPEPPGLGPSPSTKRYKSEEKENSHKILDKFSKQNCSNLKLNEFGTLKENENNNCSRPILRKSISLNDAQIMTALSRSSSEPDLIGDFSKPFCLPLMDGRHQDLKSISSETVSRLVRGEFNDIIASYKIVDCRYPYEYDGGHIHGALNFYTHEQILDELVNNKLKTETTTAQQLDLKQQPRHILVFHCEFSSERGPKLSRFLRNHDRLQNSNSYPSLLYPEIYLLHGGYKEFYENYKELCDPIAYRPMLEPSFGEQYRHFRAKSKSWNGDIKLTTSKYGLKKSRSRLIL